MVAWGRTNVGIRGALLALLLALASFGLALPAAAQDAGARGRHSQPAMPLAEALRQFARTSSYDVVFPEELVKGRQSAPVKDARNAHDALAQMLAGSGLVPRFTRPDAFILEAPAAAAPADLSLERIEVVSPPLGQREAAYRWYGEKLLEASLETLRHSREMGMRSYDFTIYVWLSAEGTIIDLEGHGGSGQSEVLGLATGMLKGLVLGIAPPTDMPQPVGLRITAQ